jgi:hypothetical protein
MHHLGGGPPLPGGKLLPHTCKAGGEGLTESVRIAFARIVIAIIIIVIIIVAM